MCNLYSLRTGPAELRRAFGVRHDRTGNLPPLPAIFPDRMAPVVWNAPGGRELAMMRWGIPGPKVYGAQPVTNVRNLASPHWRPWLEPAHRCLVPATAFSEYADAKPRKIPVWFARDDDRSLFAFAGIWRPWTGVRGTKRENPERAAQEHRLFSFLTTEANGVVGAVHPKAMPVLLTEPDEWAAWLEAPVEEALRLQRPLPDAAMREVARGELADGHDGDEPDGPV